MNNSLTPFKLPQWFPVVILAMAFSLAVPANANENDKIEVNLPAPFAHLKIYVPRPAKVKGKDPTYTLKSETDSVSVVFAFEKSGATPPKTTESLRLKPLKQVRTKTDVVLWAQRKFPSLQFPPFTHASPSPSPRVLKNSKTGQPVSDAEHLRNTATSFDIDSGTVYHYKIFAGQNDVELVYMVLKDKSGTIELETAWPLKFNWIELKSVKISPH